MKKFILLCLFGSVAAGNAHSASDVIWYDKAGTNPLTSLPIGNGRMGGLVLGGAAEENIVISEDTVWSGKPHDYTNVGSHQYLKELRELILTERYDEAAEFGVRHSLGIPRRQERFQALGNLELTFPGHENPKRYRRELNMRDGIAKISYQIDDAVFTREIFASHPDQVIVIRISCNRKGRISLSATLNSLHEGYSVFSRGSSELVISGKAEAVQFQSRIKVRHSGGTLSHVNESLNVEKANSLVILLVARTNFVKYDDISADPAARCELDLAAVEARSFTELKQRHIADFRSLYDRVHLNLRATDKEQSVPTDELLQDIRSGRHSLLLEELLFKYGRYLTISGARSGTQPLNLVGIWPTEGLNAPWGGKWTLNINAELNTWPVETTALPECHEPLLSLLEDLRVTGRRVAKEHYDCRGFVAHHNTDLWRGAAPVDTAIHGLWTMGSAWLCRHIWEHYDFSRDMSYLREAYPTMKEAASFYEDFLIEGPDGYLATCPAISFEQSFQKIDGTAGRLTYAPTMDNQILRDLFSNCVGAAEALGTDADKRDTWKLIASRLRPNQIDPDTGRIMEWAFQAEQPSISGQLAPLWGVSPGREINIHDTPELAEATIKFMEHVTPRVPGFQSAGSWVTGTHLNTWARLERSEEAYRVLNKAIREKASPNLMMLFYNQNYFQVDGNMGITAGIAEMLLQSHRLNEKGEPILDLLPALPQQWPVGSVSGLRARGAFTIDINWKDGKVQETRITSRKGTPLNLCYKGKDVSLSTKAGETIRLNGLLQ